MRTIGILFIFIVALLAGGCAKSFPEEGGYYIAIANLLSTSSTSGVSGFTMEGTGSLLTREDGTTDSFTLRLNSEPGSAVTLGPITSNQTAEITVSPSSLTFDPTGGANPWDTAQTITLTGVDDTVSDGHRPVTIDLGTIQTGDGNLYPAGKDPGDVQGINIDDETIGLTISTPASLQTTEGGATVSFTVELKSEPQSQVTVGPFVSSDTSEGQVTTPAGGTLTFDPTGGANPWNISQTVIITGQPDDGDTSSVAYQVTSQATTSSDVLWDGIQVSTFDLQNVGIITESYQAPVTSAGVFTSIQPTGTPVPFSSTGDGYAEVPIGFSFAYNGVVYSNVSINTKGAICFVNTPIDCLNWTNGNLFAVATPPNVVTPWWDDFQVDTLIPQSGGYTSVTGASPNQVFTVEWHQIQDFGGADDHFTFQVKLYETSNRIEFHYGPVSNVDLVNSTDASAGIKLGTGGDCLYYDVTTGATGLSCSGTTGNSALTVTDFPPSGTIYTIDPVP